MEQTGVFDWTTLIILLIVVLIISPSLYYLYATGILIDTLAKLSEDDMEDIVVDADIDIDGDLDW